MKLKSKHLALNHNQSDALPHQIHPDSARGSLELNVCFSVFFKNVKAGS